MRRRSRQPQPGRAAGRIASCDSWRPGPVRVPADGPVQPAIRPCWTVRADRLSGNAALHRGRLSASELHRLSTTASSFGCTIGRTSSWSPSGSSCRVRRSRPRDDKRDAARHALPVLEHRHGRVVSFVAVMFSTLWYVFARHTAAAANSEPPAPFVRAAAIAGRRRRTLGCSLGRARQSGSEIGQHREHASVIVVRGW